MSGWPKRAIRVVRTVDEPAILDRLLSAREVAERLGVGREVVYALIRTGHLQRVAFPNSPMVRVAASEVEAFIKRGGAP